MVGCHLGFGDGIGLAGVEEVEDSDVQEETEVGEAAEASGEAEAGKVAAEEESVHEELSEDLKFLLEDMDSALDM